MVKCELCGREFNKMHGLNTHITGFHKFTPNEVKEYYDIHFKKAGDGICPFTGTATKFIGFTQGYARFSNDPITKKKALATNSIEYLMKVRKMSEQEAIDYKTSLNKYYSNNNKRIFSENQKNDPSYVRSMSRYCKEFWIKKGFSEEVSVEKALAECAKNRAIFKTKLKAQPEKYKNRWQSQLQYWIDKGYSEQESMRILKERQRTFTLEKLIAKHGAEEGTRIWRERQEKWSAKWKEKYNAGEFTTTAGKSLISIRLFSEVIMAMHRDKKDYLFGEKNELVLFNENNKQFYYDFADYDKKLIIEFNGRYWHCDPRKYDPDYVHGVMKITAAEIWERDAYKIKLAESRGYNIITVWEDDYLADPAATIEMCVKFLTNGQV